MVNLDGILARLTDEPEFAQALRDRPEAALAGLPLTVTELERLAAALGEPALALPPSEQRIWMGRWLGLMARAADRGEL